ncbi:MAG: 30S ribosomal protein S17 [Desulfatitalea sp.]|nr:30S ribosomal protein S17 [Desulfatitalea sp.]NNK00215.1 30S ribosomal protein S17 [Desulfatitalea sp.]
MKTRGTRRQVVGTIVSNKMDKTVLVVTERLVKHPMYKKYIRRKNKYMAHDNENACGIGDKVLITESRPISKTKRWRVSKIVEKAI